MEPPQKRRRRMDSNFRGDAEGSGAADTADMMGHLNTDLSTIPQKTLLSVGAEIGRSQAGQQPTQINTAIGQGVGRMGNGITNPMLLRDLWNGNVALDLGDIHAIAEQDEKELEKSQAYWLGKLRNTEEFRDRVESREFDNVPAARLRSLFESVSGMTDVRGDETMVEGGERRRQRSMRDEERKRMEEQKQGMMGGKAQEGGGEGGFQRIPLSQKISTIGSMANNGNEDEEEDERKDIQFGWHSKYTQELLPFLPIVGASAIGDTRPEKQTKALNEALFSNIIRDPLTGDPNINPLAMGLRIEEGLRFNGENKILDPVFPGGSLNIGALPATTERLMIEPSTLETEARKIISDRNMKQRKSCVNDYKKGLFDLASREMTTQMTDVQWVNANKSVNDFQHVSSAFNTMPVPPEMWIHRRQIDGDVPFQDNLLPAQGLFIHQQMGCGELQTAQPYLPSTRQNITFNNPNRFGWNYGTQFK